MKLNRSMALILMTSFGGALFVWSHAHANARKTGAPANHQLDRDEETGPILAGTIVPTITTPIVGRQSNLAVPLNTWVKRGQVIGTTEFQNDPGDRDRAWQEVEEARFDERRAQDDIRQNEEELCTLQEQVGSMDREEALAENVEVNAEREFERQDTLFRSGLTSRIDYNSAATARASSDAAVDSIRSKLASSAIEIDEWQGKAQEAEAALREATTRRNAAEAVFQRMQESPREEPMVSPADGILVASGKTAVASLGIASDPRQLCAYAMVRQADIMAVRVGQRVQIALDARPGVTLAGTVSKISEIPVDLAEGRFYEVAFVVENPGGAWLSGAAMHVRMARSFR